MDITIAVDSEQARTQQEVWRNFDEQIVLHMNQPNLRWASTTKPTHDLENLNWVLMKLGNKPRPGQKERKINHDPLAPHEFTLHTLSSLARAVSNPLSSLPLLFISKVHHTAKTPH